MAQTPAEDRPQALHEIKGVLTKFMRMLYPQEFRLDSIANCGPMLAFHYPLLAGEMKNTARMYKHPLKSAGFRVLKAPDVPSVLVELGYVSNKSDLEHLVSENWRSKTVGSMAQAIDAFFAKRLATAGPAN